MTIFDSTLALLERALDARSLRHVVLSGNLANADTPGFVPRDLDFASAMAEAADRSGPPAAPPPAAEIGGMPLASGELAPPSGIQLVSAGFPVAGGEPRPSPEIPLATAAPRPWAPAALGPSAANRAGDGAGLDGNAVDVDRALVAVAENALQYGAVARAAGKKLAILRYAASDGQP